MLRGDVDEDNVVAEERGDNLGEGEEEEEEEELFSIEVTFFVFIFEFCEGEVVDDMRFSSLDS